MTFTIVKPHQKFKTVSITQNGEKWTYSLIPSSIAFIENCSAQKKEKQKKKERRRT